MFRIFNIFKTYDTDSPMISKCLFKLRMRSERWRQRKNVTQGIFNKIVVLAIYKRYWTLEQACEIDMSKKVVYLPWEFPSWWFWGPWCCFGTPIATTQSALDLASSLHDLLLQCQLNEVSTCCIWTLWSCSLRCWTRSTCKNLKKNEC